MLSSSSSMSSPFSLLLGDHASPSSLYTPSSTPTSSRATFTRVSRGIPANNSTSLFTTSSTPPSKPTTSSTSTAPSSYFSLSKSSSECTAKTTTTTTTTIAASPIYSHSNVKEKHSQHGLNRFRPSLHDTAPSDFLEDIHKDKGVQSSSTPFTALRRIDRKDIQLDPALVLLSQDELAEKHVASASSAARFSTSSYRPNTTTDSLIVDKAVSKPCPTFTRITKPRTPAPAPAAAARTGFYRLGDSGNNNSNNASTSPSASARTGASAASKSTSAGLDLLLGSETLSFPQASLLHEQNNCTDKTMPSLSLSTSSPSSSCLPSPWSPPSTLSLSPSSSAKHQPHPSLKAPTLLLPPLSLSLSLSPPPSSVPSLSSSASSACSSASSSSSPPTSHFLFPTVDHHDWWQVLGSTAAPSPSGLEQEGRGEAGGSRTAPGTASGSCLSNPTEDRPQDLLAATATSTPLSHTFYRQQPQSRESLKSDDLMDKDPVVDHLSLTPAGSAGLDLATTNNHQSKDSSIAANSNSSIPATGTPPRTTTTPSTRKTYSLARARAPSPPLVITGFCSISKTPIKPSGEPSPQDFLGEADLPYPLPSTLHDRQTRQRKRAEQLRQLKIREECEAQEKNNCINNRRRVIRRRGASFSAGMMYPPLSSTSFAFSPPSSSTSRTSSSNSTPGSPALFSDSPRMHRQQQQQQQPSTASFRSAAWHQQRLSLNQHLKRSPSSPTRGSSSVNNLHLLNRHSTCNIGQGSKEKAAMLSVLASLPSPPPRRRVVFDLESIQVFEYDVSGDDWSPSSGPSSPTMPPASTNGRDSYVRYVPPSDCSSSGSSSDEESSPRPRVLTRDLKSKA